MMEKAAAPTHHRCRPEAYQSGLQSGLMPAEDQQVAEEGGAHAGILRGPPEQHRPLPVRGAGHHCLFHAP